MSDFGPLGSGGGGGFSSGSSRPFPTSAWGGFPGSGFGPAGGGGGGGGGESASARPTPFSSTSTSAAAAASQTSIPAASVSEEARVARATTKAVAVSSVLGGIVLLMPLIFFLYLRWKKKHPDSNAPSSGDDEQNADLHEKAAPNVRTVSSGSEIGVMIAAPQTYNGSSNRGPPSSSVVLHNMLGGRAPVDPFQDEISDFPPHPYEGRIRPGMGVQRKNSYDSIMIASMA